MIIKAFFSQFNGFMTCFMLKPHSDMSMSSASCHQFVIMLTKSPLKPEISEIDLRFCQSTAAYGTLSSFPTDSERISLWQRMKLEKDHEY